MAEESSAIPRRSLACVRRGIPVVWADLDAGPGGLSRPVVRCRDHQPHAPAGGQPRHLPLEGGRVGRQVIVGFPNFGHWLDPLPLFLAHGAHAKVAHASL